MKEIKATDTAEFSKRSVEAFQQIRPETDIKPHEAKEFWKNLYEKKTQNSIETPEMFQEKEYLTPYEDRLKITPVDGPRGEWTEERGESRFIPNAETEDASSAREKLSEFNLDGIDYKDALPDFSTCAKETVKIEMTDSRYGDPNKGIIGNFEKADSACAEKWNEAGYEGRTDWKPRDIKAYRSDNKLSWHECVDQETCQMVPREIHEFFTHVGGISECRRKAGLINGGGFDD